MSAPWVIGSIALWVVVLTEGFVLLGLLRRYTGFLEVLEDRLHVLQFAETLQGLQPGDAVTDFEARDEHGCLHRAADLLQRPAVFVLLDPGCEPCEKLATEVSEANAQFEGTPLYLVTEGVDAKRWRFRAPVAVLYQEARSVAQAFRSSVTPQAFAVDGHGIVVARAIPQSARDLQRLVERLAGEDRAPSILDDEIGPRHKLRSR